MKGQMNLPNYIMLFIVFMLAIFMMPVLNQVINTSTTQISGSTNPMIGVTIAIMQLMPLMLVIGCILTAIYWAMPSREGQ